MSEPVLLEIKNHVSVIILNDPGKGNTVNDENLLLMKACLEKSIASEECRVIVIEGKDGIFSKGMDFSNLLKNESTGITADFTAPYKDVIRLIRNSVKPVIAKVDGQVLAGGMGLALACDMIIATKTSTFGLSEVLFGIIPAYVFPLLVEKIPFKKARYLVLSSRNLTGGEAYDFGIVDELVEPGLIDKAVKRQVKRLLFSSPDALRTAKEYSDRMADSNIDMQLDAAQKQLDELLNDPRNIEAIKDFIDGRKPMWS